MLHFVLLHSFTQISLRGQIKKKTARLGALLVYWIKLWHARTLALWRLLRGWWTTTDEDLWPRLMFTTLCTRFSTLSAISPIIAIHQLGVKGAHHAGARASFSRLHSSGATASLCECLLDRLYCVHCVSIKNSYRSERPAWGCSFVLAKNKQTKTKLKSMFLMCNICVNILLSMCYL